MQRGTQGFSAITPVIIITICKNLHFPLIDRSNYDLRREKRSKGKGRFKTTV